MRRVTQSFIYALLSAALVTSAVAQEDKPPRVRAKEPTVVTVEGTQKEVGLDREQQAEGKSNPVKKAVQSVGRGVVNGIGWLLRVNDDIPSERERTREEQRSQ
jgi:hypothetical protein